MTGLEFRQVFESLTGNVPLRWQERLFHDHFARGDFCDVIDLPTGLGKTMVMAIWLIARGVNKRVPRRLVYVVDRRTVVDQATDIAMRLVTQPMTKWMHDNFEGQPPTISTLRGQLADNREWSRDPSRPAIIIGTVDLIGSALLFSGYRSSYKRRPLEAGLLGQDSLLVLDEAHLSKPFERLLVGRKRFDGERENGIVQFQHGQSRPMQVIRMSATGDNSPADKVFRLVTDAKSPTCDLKSDLDPLSGEERNQIITRFNARKRLRIVPDIDPRKTNDALYNQAIGLANDETVKGKRIVVFVRSPEDAQAIANSIREHDKPKKSKSTPEPKGPYADSVEVLTGTLRGLERDKLVEKEVFTARWLNGELDPTDAMNEDPVFLISTSAGEVGFDLNADHLVCDAAPLDSMIQRLGRVNRRGLGDATVVLVVEDVPVDKAGIPKTLNPFESAVQKTVDLFTAASQNSLLDVSPNSLANLKERWKDDVATASSPEPTMVELTDILLDAWSMTSITERMPGRPEVAPWLRGIADDLPQTTVAWRTELDLLHELPVCEKALKAVFNKHRIRAHESLTTNSSRVVEFLKQAVKSHARVHDTRVVVKLSRDITILTIGELIKDSGILNADPTLILPASFGGLDCGLLCAAAISIPTEDDDVEVPSLDVADKAGYESRGDDRPRLRLIIKRTDEGWTPLPLPGGEPIPAYLNLESTYETQNALFNAIHGSGLRRRLVQSLELDEEGTTVQSLVLLAPIGNKSKPERQTLEKHVGFVEAEAQRITDECGLKDPIRAALLFAAKWHDEGKKADVWQRYIGRAETEPALGKAATTRDPKSLHGYRHEFGSLLRIHHPERHSTGCELPADAETRNLALHLIVTHHGFGRPHFDNPIDRDFSTEQTQRIHTEVIRRFARLQRKYGWWQLAWLENLLRCADALASADPDADDTADGDGGET